MKNILLSGKPGVGKTTLLIKVLKRLKGKNIGGFYTEEIRQQGVRRGFKIKTLNGQEGILAHQDIKSKYKVGKYGVNMGDLEEIAASAIKNAIEESDAIAIDEIGKMELYSEKFRDATLQALNSSKPVLATIPHFQNEFLMVMKARQDVELITITPDNRDQLVAKIIQRLTELR